MKRKSLVVPVLIAILVVANIVAAADYTLTRVDPNDVRVYDPTRTAATCEVGNLNSAAYSISGFLEPPEKYALVFDPAASCLDCDLGVKITKVHIMLSAAAACDMEIKVSLMHVEGQCPVPTDLICGHFEYSVSLSEAGVWDIGLPLDCFCADPGYPYALKVKIASASCTDDLLPDLVIDNAPSFCTSYREVDGVWSDLGVAGVPGTPMIWADAECCWAPVSSESESWGGLKALYR